METVYIVVETGEELDSRELREMYNEMLDDCHEMVRIGNLEYTPSDVLESVDPLAYRIGFDEWLDGQVEDGIFEEKEV